MVDVTVEVERDHLAKLVRPTQPASAVIELIWNALDADADEVRVDFERNDLEGIEAVIVSDNGSGIPVSASKTAFSKLGGSWKASAKVSPGKKRPMHGRDGEGRFRSFALGEHVSWRTVADDVNGRFETTISADASRPEVFNIADGRPTSERTGTRVRVLASGRPLSTLDSEETERRIAKEFARHLRRFRVITIIYNGKPVDPATIIDVAHTKEVVLDPPHALGNPTLEIIEWSAKFGRELVLCDGEGFPLADFAPRIHAPNFNFTAYVSWAGFDPSDVLLADTGHEKYLPILSQVRSAIRDYFKNRARERISEVVESWKSESVYPFSGEPKDVVESAKRDLFDVVAAQAIPALAGDRRSKRLSLRLIREALEQSPTALQRVLRDVIELNEEQIQDLAALLDRTSFSAIISAARLVSDRLDFLRSIEYLLFDERVKNDVLERTQLHRIIAAESWIFGDHFAVAVDDEGIQQVLRRHLESLGRDTLNLAHVPVEGKKTAIVDLMLTKTIEDSQRQHHLVVELKRPSVRIGHKEKTQIEQYGIAVANDPQFRGAETKWDFVLMANGISPEVSRLAKKKGQPPGLIHDDDELDLRIWIKDWGRLIDERRRALYFIRDRLVLNSSTDHGIELLRQKHAEYLPESAFQLDE
ncbi:ATP-binding protein [Micromonospora sp. NPDC048898]|uniref:ATP-binding protein n=1 Tax=Micromonospora sp. NPDC048898 TaxID=3364260 RepID=UPI0037130D9D